MPREMVFAQVIGVIGTVLIGFGLYGYFLDGSHLHPLLNSSDVTLTMIIVGVVLWAAELRLLIPILLRMAKQQGRK
jgi:Mg/Co/Ni transporter MgtE